MVFMDRVAKAGTFDYYCMWQDFRGEQAVKGGRVWADFGARLPGMIGPPRPS